MKKSKIYKIIAVSSHFLKNGLYFRNKNNISKVRLVNIFSILKFWNIIIIFSFKKIAKESTLYFYYRATTDKTLIFVGDNVVSLYSKSKKHELLNSLSFCKMSNYNKSPLIYYNVRRYFLVFKKIVGSSNFEEDVCKEILINTLSNAKLIVKSNPLIHYSNERCYYLFQHGDLTCNNVINNDGHFVYIDFDNAQYLPLLYDYFHYIFTSKINGIKYMKISNMELIKQIKEKVAFKGKCNEFIDYYFSIYIFLSKKYQNVKISLPPKNIYKRSHIIFKELNNGNSINN